MRFLYSGLDDRRDVVLSDRGLPASEKTAIEAQIFDCAQVTRRAVSETRADFETVFDLEKKTALDKGAVVIQVWQRRAATLKETKLK